MQTSAASTRVLSVQARLTDFLHLTKPRIMLLSVLTVLGSMALAGNAWPEFSLAAWTCLGVALAVGAGGALNCFIERDLDRRMARTANRPIPSGRMRPSAALVFGTVLWIGSYFVLYFHANPLTAFLTMLAFGTYVGLYTPLKTRTSLCTLVGAIPGALPTLIGWSAVRGSVESEGFVLFLILFFWQIPHFLALALLYRDEYSRAGMPMFPVPHGDRSTLLQMLLYTAALLPVSILPFGRLHAGWVYLTLAVALGIVSLGLVLRGLTRGADQPLCRRFFAFSILHLSILFGALVFGV